MINLLVIIDFKYLNMSLQKSMNFQKSDEVEHKQSKDHKLQLTNSVSSFKFGTDLKV